MAEMDKGRFSMFGDRSNTYGNSHQGHNDHQGGAHTPQYIIACEDFFCSDLVDGDCKGDGFIKVPKVGADGAPLLWFEIGGSRLLTYDSAGENMGDGRMVARDPIACMRYGSWAPIIQNYMFMGQSVETINILKTGSINGVHEIIQLITFKKNHIKIYEQEGDTIIFSFCFEEITDEYKTFDHEGKANGVVASTFNYASRKIDFKG